MACGAEAQGVRSPLMWGKASGTAGSAVVARGWPFPYTHRKQILSNVGSCRRRTAKATQLSFSHRTTRASRTSQRTARLFDGPPARGPEG